MEVTMYDKLLQLPLLQGLCKNDFTNILEKVKLHFHQFEPNEYVVRQGEECRQLLFLLDGVLQSESADEHHSYILQESFEAPFIIEPYSMFGMRPCYTASYQAQTAVNVMTIDKQYVLSELNNYEIFRLNYLNMLSNRAQTVYYKLWNTHIGKTHEKIFNFLWLRCTKHTGCKKLYIKMEALAELIDDTRINVSKILNDLQKQNLIELSRKTIIIPDLQALMENYKDNE